MSSFCLICLFVKSLEKEEITAREVSTVLGSCGSGRSPVQSDIAHQPSRATGLPCLQSSFLSCHSHGRPMWVRVGWGSGPGGQPWSLAQVARSRGERSCHPDVTCDSLGAGRDPEAYTHVSDQSFKGKAQRAQDLGDRVGRGFQRAGQGKPSTQHQPSLQNGKGHGKGSPMGLGLKEGVAGSRAAAPMWHLSGQLPSL